MHNKIRSSSNQRDPFVLLHGGTQAEAQSHAAQPNGRDFQIAFPRLRFFIASSHESNLGLVMMLLRAVVRASELVELLPNRGKRERKSSRPQIQAGTQLRSIRERSY